MNKMGLQRRAFMSMVLMTVATVGALAEVADLSLEKLIYFSDHDFVGTVAAVESKDIPNNNHPTWSNRHFRLTVRVEKVYKTVKHAKQNPDADDETVPAPQSEVHVMMWQALQRPEKWVGPRGVRRLPKVGEQVSFFALYLHKDPQRRSMYHQSFPHEDDSSRPVKAYNVLTPNGIGDAELLLDKVDL